MNKNLFFQITYNQKKAPRVYIKIRKTNEIIGSFSFDNLPCEGDFVNLPDDIQIEINRFVNNIKAIVPHIDKDKIKIFNNFNFRLPMNMLEAINKIEKLYQKEGKSFDIYQPMVDAITQTIMKSGFNVGKLVDPPINLRIEKPINPNYQGYEHD